MKQLTFSVTVTFESSIDDDNDVMEVARNIAYAIRSSANNAGIAPDHCDTYAEKVRVREPLTNEVFELPLVDFDTDLLKDLEV